MAAVAVLGLVLLGRPRSHTLSSRGFGAAEGNLEKVSREMGRSGTSRFRGKVAPAPGLPLVLPKAHEKGCSYLV